MRNLICGDSVSEVWAEILRKIISSPGKELSPLMVEINNTDYDETHIIKLLDNNLESLKKPKVNTTANTIFPMSLYVPGRTIYERFDVIWPYIKKCPLNKYGHYFRRLTSYAEYDEDKKINQLEHIINTYNNGNHRRSALIATIFDPVVDHSNMRRKIFPCLQQICLLPDSKNKSLTLSAIYAMQYLFDRAFGNYLGLVRLGRFMADEMNLKFTKLICISTTMHIGSINKSYGSNLLDEINNNGTTN